MLRNVDLNLEEIKYNLTRKAAETYMETGYTLLALEQLVSLFQFQSIEKPKKPRYFRFYSTLNCGIVILMALVVLEQHLFLWKMM